MEHVDTIVVGGHAGVRREVFRRRIRAALHARNAPDTHGRDRVVVERTGLAAAVDMVHAAAVVCIG